MVKAMSSQLPTVSIVIPAFNEEATIGPCVRAALNQTVDALEVIVVDNRSTDSTGAIVQALQTQFPDAPLRYVKQDLVQGLVPTRNLGLDTARGDAIGRIDADTIVSETWVQEVQRAFVDAEVAATTGPVAYYDMPLQRWGLKADNTVRRVMLKLARNYHFVFGSNMAVRSTAWQQIREEVCLDEDDELHEDIDISVHLHNNGLRVKYVPTMVAGMSARRIDDSPRDYLYYVTRFERTYQRHGVWEPGLRAPMWLFLLLYPALKIMRKEMARRTPTAEAPSAG